MFDSRELIVWLQQRQQRARRMRGWDSCQRIKRLLLQKELTFAIVEEWVREKSGIPHSWEEEE